MGETGKRRCIIKIGRRDVDYDVPEGGVRWCGKTTFARWAVREAPEEIAP